MGNHLFDKLIGRDAGATPALVADERNYSYADLADETARWAGALTALGVKPGDRIAVQAEKSAEGLILYLAALRAGAIFLPLNPAYTRAELGYFVGDAEPALIVCDPAARAGIAEIAGATGVQTLDKAGQGDLAELARSMPADFETAQRGPEDLAAICYTSGTTGRSKGAMLTHGSLAANAATLARIWRFTSDDVLIHALPIYHVHGLFVATHVSLMAGAAMIPQRRFDPAQVIAAMARATVLMGAPTYYTRLLSHPDLTREAASHMRLFISGSAPLLPSTHGEWRARTGHAILERYGMTETGMNASNPYDGERVPGAVGPALPDVELRIVDETSGAILPTAAAGLVEVRGPNVFAGYWRNLEKTREAFTADGWFRTGDLGTIDAKGYLRLIGRASDLIITGGLNVYPAEVEAAIDAAPGVIESAVIGLPHSDLGEAVTAVVVTSDETLTETAVLAGLAETLARFKQPKRVLFAANLPRNAMGKVMKATLRETHAGLYAPSPAGP